MCVVGGGHLWVLEPALLQAQFGIDPLGSSCPLCCVTHLGDPEADVALRSLPGNCFLVLGAATVEVAARDF